MNENKMQTSEGLIYEYSDSVNRKNSESNKNVSRKQYEHWPNGSPALRQGVSVR